MCTELSVSFVRGCPWLRFLNLGLTISNKIWYTTILISKSFHLSHFESWSNFNRYRFTLEGKNGWSLKNTQEVKEQ